MAQLHWTCSVIDKTQRQRSQNVLAFVWSALVLWGAMGGRCCGPTSRADQAQIDDAMRKKEEATKEAMKELYKAKFGEQIRESLKARTKPQALDQGDASSACAMCMDQAQPGVAMEPCGCCAKRMCASCLSDTRSIPQFNLPNPVLICGACSQVIDQHDQDVKAAKDAKNAKRKDRRGESPGARGVPTTPRPEKRGGGSPRSSRASTPRSNARTKEREKLLELKVCCEGNPDPGP